MSKYLVIHQDNPQTRLLLQAIGVLKSGGVVAVPTDCSYVICCQIGDKEAEKKISFIRDHHDHHLLALVLPNLSMASTYAQISNMAFKVMKAATPGAYTFILPAKKDLPKRLHQKRSTIGIRIPDNKIFLELLALYNLPLYSSTLWLPDDDFPLFDPEQIYDKLNNTLDLIIDGGAGIPETTTIVSLLDDKLEILREGKGDTSRL